MIWLAMPEIALNRCLGNHDRAFYHQPCSSDNLPNDRFLPGLTWMRSQKALLASVDARGSAAAISGRSKSLRSEFAVAPRNYPGCEQFRLCSAHPQLPQQGQFFAK